MESSAFMQLQQQYEEACRTQQNAALAVQYADAWRQFSALHGYLDSDLRAQQCRQRSEALSKEYAYQHACLVQEKQQYANAIRVFQTLGDYKDSIRRLEECRSQQAKRKNEEHLAQQMRQQASQEQHQKKKKIRGRILSLSAAAIACVLLVQLFLLPMMHYNRGESFLMAGDVQQAAISFGKAGSFRDARERSLALWAQFAQRSTVTGSDAYASDIVPWVVAVRSDGSVTATCDRKDYAFSDWHDVVDISDCDNHIAGLCADGTVFVTGSDNSLGQQNMPHWKNIVDICVGNGYTAGLKTDGTMTGTTFFGDKDHSLSDWKNIVSIDGGNHFVLGLTADGTVMAAGFNEFGQCDVSQWTEITAVSAGARHSVGLRADGTVTSAGSNAFEQCSTSDWTDIVQVSTGYLHTVGLRSDGTVVACGNNRAGQCSISHWTDIAAVFAVAYATVGIRHDGTVLYAGATENAEDSCTLWTDIVLPPYIEAALS